MSNSSRGQSPWIITGGKVRETKRKKGDQWGTSSKIKQSRGTWASIAIASGLAKEAGVASTVGSHGICSDGRSRKNKCSHDDPSTENRVFSKELICYGCG